MSPEVKETVTRFMWDAYEPLLQKIKRESSDPVDIYDLYSNIIQRLGGWNSIYILTQKSLDYGVSLGEQEKHLKATLNDLGTDAWNKLK